jgi:L-iditol 2-dehydrogenase
MVRAAILEEVGRLEVEDFPRPEVGAKSLLMRVELCGICGTDIHLYHGRLRVPLPIIPGHEFVGRVEEIDDEARGLEVLGNPLSEGELITVVPGTSAFCGTCYYCRFIPQRPTLCQNRRVLGVNMSCREPPHLYGGWSEHLYVDAGHWWVYKVPEGMPPEVAVLTEPMAVSTRALERAFEPGFPTSGEGFGLGSTVVVQGVGPIGLLVVATARLMGARLIIAIDGIERRLRMAERMGADHTIDMRAYRTSEDRVAEVERLTGNVGADVVVECAGAPAAFPEGIRMTRRGGRLVEVGHFTDPGGVEIRPHLICWKDIDILGCWAYPPAQFKKALEALEMGMDTLPLGELVTDRFSVDKAPEALSYAERREGLKVAITP